MTKEIEQRELSRVFQIEELANDPVSREFSASEEERSALAGRLGVELFNAVRAELSLAGFGSEGIRVEGRVFAELVQNCVVTLEPVEERISEPVAVTYLTKMAEPPEDVEFAALDEEEIEEFDGESIDLGELIAQTLAGAINPYPRKEGAAFGKADGLGDNDAGVRENPFAVLKGLKAANGNAEEG